MPARFTTSWPGAIRGTALAANLIGHCVFEDTDDQQTFQAESQAVGSIAQGVLEENPISVIAGLAEAIETIWNEVENSTDENDWAVDRG